MLAGCRISRRCARSPSSAFPWSLLFSTIQSACTSHASSSANACNRSLLHYPPAFNRCSEKPATAFGELYQYTLSGPMSAMDLKDLHEWVIKPQLRTNFPESVR